MTVEKVLETVERFEVKLVEITGGEPLVQEETPELARCLLENNYTTLVETSGSLDISVLPEDCHRIVDFKTPSCGMAGQNLWDNVRHLTDNDEVKFVIGNLADYEWARERITEFDLLNICPLSLSPVFGKLNNKTLAEWILRDSLEVRLNLQIHKYIWDSNTRGV